MGVNSLPKTVTRQRRGCDLDPGPSAPESSKLIARLPSHPVPSVETSISNWQMLQITMLIILASVHNLGAYRCRITRHCIGFTAESVQPTFALVTRHCCTMNSSCRFQLLSRALS